MLNGVSQILNISSSGGYRGRPTCNIEYVATGKEQCSPPRRLSPSGMRHTSGGGNGRTLRYGSNYGEYLLGSSIRILVDIGNRSVTTLVASAQGDLISTISNMWDYMIVDEDATPVAVDELVSSVMSGITDLASTAITRHAALVFAEIADFLAAHGLIAVDVMWSTSRFMAMFANSRHGQMTRIRLRVNPQEASRSASWVFTEFPESVSEVVECYFEKDDGNYFRDHIYNMDSVKLLFEYVREVRYAVSAREVIKKLS